MARLRWLWPLVFAALLSCSAQRLASGPRPDPQLITENEVVASLATTAYELIHRLRPNFLTYRGETSFERSKSQPYPTVYVDGQEFGPIGTLRNIPASQIATIRLYRSWEATTKFGSGNLGGVIAITTRQ